MRMNYTFGQRRTGSFTGFPWFLKSCGSRPP
jgi:hypothetical protein